MLIPWKAVGLRLVFSRDSVSSMLFSRARSWPRSGPRLYGSTLIGYNMWGLAPPHVHPMLEHVQLLVGILTLRWYPHCGSWVSGSISILNSLI